MKKINWNDRSMEKNSNWKGGMRIEPSGRVMIRINRKYIPRYRLVMEAYLGRKLKKGEIIHHINGVVNDDVIENLQLMTQSEHARLHGLNTSEETKRKKKTATTGENNPFFGKHHKKETIELLKQIAKKRKPIRIGAIISQEQRNKTSISLKAYFQTEEGILAKQKIHEVHVGKIPWNKGLIKDNEEHT